MPTDHTKYNLYSSHTPLAFSDGTAIYEELAKSYETHDVGYFILAPSGSGKTYFVEHQDNPHWLDGDDLWMATGAMPSGEWWNEPLEEIFYVERKCDVATTEAKKLGFWIVGASSNWLIPDAIVLPDWEQHKQWIKHREETAYDGGMTSDKLGQVQNHRTWMQTLVDQGVPKFETVAEAAHYLANLKQA